MPVHRRFFREVNSAFRSVVIELWSLPWHATCPDDGSTLLFLELYFEPVCGNS